jgi:TonB-dependent SusC/RagA subfamily outer membrane receptor
MSNFYKLKTDAMKRRITLLVIILFAQCSILLAQNNTTVKGAIKDERGSPLPGVTVTIKGTTNAAISDVNGLYSISVPSNATLVYSFIGYDSKEEIVNGRSEINVSLTPNVKQLESVVVIGYGSQKKKDITTAISTVSVKDVSQRPVVNTAEVLAGKAPGVQVFNASGAPGGGNLSVRIRGLSSPNGTEPVYVIDGVIVRSTESLDPNNIESISVLKDASAAGIYGSLGATNGVKKLDMLNADQFKSLMNDEYANIGQSAPSLPSNFTANNNWQDLVYRKATQSGVNVGLSGGSDKGTFYLGLGAINQDGIINGTILNVILST